MTDNEVNPPPASPSVPTSGESGLQRDRSRTPPEGIFCYPVTEETVEIEFKRLMRELPQNLSAEETRELIPKIKAQARELAVNRRLLLEEAGRRAIEAPDSEINAILARAGEQNPETREEVRNACKVEKLIATVIAAVPGPDREEIMTYLKESAGVDTAHAQNPELMRKLIEKTGVLMQRLRQNKALNEFIAELRRKAECVVVPNDQ